MPSYLISVAAAGLVAIAALAIWLAAFGNRGSLEDRITDMSVKTRIALGPLETVDSEDRLSRSLFRWVVQRLPEPAADSPEGERLAGLLLQAGYSRSTALRTFHLIRLGSTAGAALLSLLIAIVTDMHGTAAIVLMATGAAAGSFLPSYYLGRRGRERQRKIGAQLSDVLDLLVVCVEAGLGLNEAIKIVGSEAERQKQEIGAELTVVSAALNAGSTLGQALREFARRTAVEDIKPLAATLIQSEQLGAQIGPALRSISDSLRTSRRLRAEEAAQKTTVKILFPLILFVLPAMMAVIVGPAMIQILHALSHSTP